MLTRLLRSDFTLKQNLNEFDTSVLLLRRLYPPDGFFMMYRISAHMETTSIQPLCSIYNDKASQPLIYLKQLFVQSDF